MTVTDDSTSPPPTASSATSTGATSTGARSQSMRSTGVANRALRGDPTTPPERWDATAVETAWRLDDFASACTTPGVAAHERVDPYWDAVWAVGSTGSWTTPDMARRHAAAGFGRLPRALTVDAHEALDRTMRGSRWRERLSLLGAVHAWRTLSAEQAAAIVGHPAMAHATSADVASLFASGIVDLGVYANGLRRTHLDGRGALLRPSKAPVFEQKIVPRLTWGEWLGVTGGQKWSARGVYDRHNLLATELGLRSAEYLNPAAVLGERFSEVDHLAGRGVGQTEIVGSQRSADLTVVRGDGLRVAFEVTSTAARGFRDKVRAWVRLLFEQPIEHNGLCVVFLVTATPETVADSTIEARSAVHQAVLAAVKEFPGSSYNRVAERVGVATWREWFPERGRMSDHFLTMQVNAPTGTPDEPWQRRDFFDPSSRPFAPSDRFDALAVVDNAALMGQTPHWMRRSGHRPPVWLAQPGVSDPPVPTADRPERTKGRIFGEATGAVGEALPYPRLRGIALPGSG